MGGCSSKQEAADPTDVTIVGGPGGPASGGKKPRKTHSGYNTDIGSQKPALSEVMEKENTESIDAVYEATGIDPWFLDHIRQINEIADAISSAGSLDRELLVMA